MLHRIDVNIGRTGAATPFAVLEPIVVAGSTISMATLHNPDDIVRKDIRPGERVIIEKAGDVIPRVVGPGDPEAANRPAPWVMPTDVSRSAAASCASPRTKWCGGARTARARRSCAAGSNTSPRAAR